MPAEPVQQLGWLADLFPSRDKIKPLLKPTPNIDQIDEVQRDILERTADRNTEVVPDWLKDSPTSGNTVKR
jgi:hypothetical protein